MNHKGSPAGNGGRLSSSIAASVGGKKTSSGPDVGGPKSTTRVVGSKLKSKATADRQERAKFKGAKNACISLPSAADAPRQGAGYPQPQRENSLGQVDHPRSRSQFHPPKLTGEDGPGKAAQAGPAAAANATVHGSAPGDPTGGCRGGALSSLTSSLRKTTTTAGGWTPSGGRRSSFAYSPAYSPGKSSCRRSGITPAPSACRTLLLPDAAADAASAARTPSEAASHQVQPYVLKPILCLEDFAKMEPSKWTGTATDPFSFDPCCQGAPTPSGVGKGEPEPYICAPITEYSGGYTEKRYEHITELGARRSAGMKRAWAEGKFTDVTKARSAHPTWRANQSRAATIESRSRVAAGNHNFSAKNRPGSVTFSLAFHSLAVDETVVSIFKMTYKYDDLPAKVVPFFPDVKKGTILHAIAVQGKTYDAAYLIWKGTNFEEMAAGRKPHKTKALTAEDVANTEFSSRARKVGWRQAQTANQGNGHVAVYVNPSYTGTLESANAITPTEKTRAGNRRGKKKRRKQAKQS